MRRDTVKRNKHYRCLEYDYEQEGDIYLVACGMEQCDPGAKYGPEIRDFYHLHIILSGTGRLITKAGTFYPHFGQMFLLKDNECVEYIADEKDPWSYCWVTYSGTEAKKISDRIGFTDGVYCLDSKTEAKNFYELICRMHEKPEMNYINDLRRRGILLEFLSMALEATDDNSKRLRRRLEHSSDMYVKKALDFIHYNYATIGVCDIVEYIGFTRSYFTTIFKKHVGISPCDYLLQYKLNKGCEILSTTNLSIQEIATQVGYENPLNFSRAFHNAFGCSPTEYRQSENVKNMLEENRFDE